MLYNGYRYSVMIFGYSMNDIDCRFSEDQPLPKTENASKRLYLAVIVNVS